MAKTDPWMSRQQANDATWVRLEAALIPAYEAAVAETLAKLWRQVLGERSAMIAASNPPDFSGAAEAAWTTWRQALNRWVRPIAYAFYREQYAEQPGPGTAATTPIDVWWRTTVDRLDDTAAHIVEDVRQEVRAHPTESIDALRDRVARVLSLDAASRKIRTRIAEVEARLSGPRTDGELLTRRVSLQADLFRVQASRARSRAYLALADADPDNADNYRDLARQAARTDLDERRIQRLLRQVDDQLFAGNEELDVDEETQLTARRRELYAEAEAADDTWRNTATLIARTTSTDVMNEATIQRAEDVERETGVELIKVWLAADHGHSPRSRPTHRKAHGQVVGLHERFRVGEALLERPGDPEGPADEIIQCRCSVSYLTREEHEEIAAVLEGTADEAEALAAGGGGWCAPSNYELPGGDIEYHPITLPDIMTAAGETVTETALEDLPPVMWHGVIAREGVYTDDGRFFESGALRIQPLPFPARFQRSDVGGHDGAVVIGNTEGVRRYQGAIRAWGTFADGALTPEVDEIQGLMATRMMRGNSVDGSNVLESNFAVHIDDQGNVFEHYRSARLRATTFVAVPAFADAEVFIGPPPEEWLMEGEPLSTEQDVPDATTELDLDDLVAAVGRVPEQLADYWLSGEGAAKLGGPDGYFTRCRSQLAAYVSPGKLSGMCANLHYRKWGTWPGQDAAADVLVAALESVKFTAADFDPVELDGPTPITITDDGHVYGHLAAWGTCHTGFSDVCVQPPKSQTGYALFHQGGVKLDTGETLRVGKLTVHAGHAKPTLGLRAATAHYDNSALAAAAVRAYEDAWGIAISGMVIPGTPDDVVEELRLSPLSGDWRAYNGNLELIAALGVNVPGFPIVGSKDGQQVSLVAAGALQADVRDQVAELAASIGLHPKEQAAMIAASIGL